MKKLLWFIIDIITLCHNFIMSINDTWEYGLSDKELHFIIIGIIGMAMVFVVYPVFKWLAKNNHIMTITWIYVFTMVIVLTFAIEIGQKATNSGVMEFADIVFGVVGFLAMFTVFAIFRAIYHGIRKLLRRLSENT